MNSVSRLTKRTMFVAAGIVFAGLSLFLIYWGVSKLMSTGQMSDMSTDATSNPNRGAGDQATQWEQFSRGALSDADAEPVALRPIEPPGSSASPFDETFARMELGRLGLRFEGAALGEQPLALISGRVVRIGDRIASYNVESIDRSGVSLLGPNGVRLELGPSAEPEEPRRAAAKAARMGADQPSETVRENEEAGTLTDSEGDVPDDSGPTNE